MTLSKERIENLIEFNAEGSDCQANAEQWEVNELARIALASLEEGLVACPKCNGTGMADSGGHQPWGEPISIPCDCTATPAQVSMKDHQIRGLVNELRDISVEYHGTQQLRERIARTIRAAMLQGADGNSPVIPDGWVLVPIEPTYHMCEAMGLQWESPRFPDRYKAMLAAVKNSRNFC